MSNPEAAVGKEVNLAMARELVASGKYIFVWMGREHDTAKTAYRLGVEEKDMLWVDFIAMADPVNEKELVKQLNGKTPIFVCFHGHTSWDLATMLEESGVKAHSLEGGVEGAR